MLLGYRIVAMVTCILATTCCHHVDAGQLYPNRVPGCRVRLNGNRQFYIMCKWAYRGEEFPEFGISNSIFSGVYVNSHMKRIQAYILVNIRTSWINIARNSIETIHPKAFWKNETAALSTHADVKFLDLSSNNIRHIESGTFDPLVNVVYIRMSANKLTSVSNALIVNLPSLRVFNIDDNLLTELPTGWLPKSMLKLGLANVGIKSLTRGTFAGAPDLGYVTLSLRYVDVAYDTFADSKKLVTFKVTPEVYPCTCAYVWYLVTLSSSVVCSTSSPDIRTYLRQECPTNILKGKLDLIINKLSEFEKRISALEIKI